MLLLTCWLAQLAKVVVERSTQKYRCVQGVREQERDASLIVAFSKGKKRKVPGSIMTGSCLSMGIIMGN